MLLLLGGFGVAAGFGRGMVFGFVCLRRWGRDKDGFKFGFYENIIQFSFLVGLAGKSACGIALSHIDIASARRPDCAAGVLVESEGIIRVLIDIAGHFSRQGGSEKGEAGARVNGFIGSDGPQGRYRLIYAAARRAFFEAEKYEARVQVCIVGYFAWVGSEIINHSGEA